MRKWNKLLALVLAMVMVFGLTATAFAADNAPAEGEKTEAADPAKDAAAPTEGEDAAAPTEGDKAPAEGEDAAAPAEGDKAPAEGEDAAAPAEGEDKKDETPAADPYADVAEWAKDAVAAVVEKKLIDVSETGFAPKETMTRGVLVEALYRLAEKPALAEDAEVKTFTDVAEDSAFAAAVAWASSTNVVAGYDDGTFLPDKAMNRAEIAAVLFRYAKAEAEAEDKLAGFPDVDKVQNWAKDALNWAVASKLIAGNGANLDPTGTATREQVAVILNRYITEVLTPAEGEDKAPAEGDKTEAPAEGDKTEAPAEGDKTEAPAEGDKTEAPAEDKK